MGKWSETSLAMIHNRIFHRALENNLQIAHMRDDPNINRVYWRDRIFHLDRGEFEEWAIRPGNGS